MHITNNCHWIRVISSPNKEHIVYINNFGSKRPEKTFFTCEISAFGELCAFVLGRLVESNSQERSCTLKFLPELNHYFGTICEFVYEVDLLIRSKGFAAPVAVFV